MEKGSSSSSSSAAGGGPPDGLKFGKKIYFEGGPAKKVRTGFAQGGQPPRCQVEGCEVDLSGVKAYYSRHKVCGVHSKSSKVIVAGLEQRFCQQCSRFHQLTEFDQGKRSCRSRLAGHNERRRKPQQGSLLSPRYGTLCPSFDNNHTKTGGFVMDFSAYPPLTGRDLFPNSTSERGSTTTQAVITGKFQLPWQSSSQNPLSDLLQGPTGRALSLLSNQPWPAPKGRLGVNNGFLGQPSDNPVGQFVCSPWSFKGDGENTTLHEMPPDLGLGQTSQPANNGQYNGELGLGQPSEGQFNELDQSRGYDSSVQHMHWSL